MLDLWSEKLNLQTKQNEPLYACYHSVNAIGMAFWFYVKTPVGSDLTCYVCNNNFEKQATSSSQLTVQGRCKSVSETEIYANSYATVPTPRYTAGDLYE